MARKKMKAKKSVQVEEDESSMTTTQRAQEKAASKAPRKQMRPHDSDEDENSDNEAPVKKKMKIPPPPRPNPVAEQAGDDDVVLEDEEENEDEDEEEVMSSQAARKPRKRRNPVILSPEIEEDLVEWLKVSPMFYNKQLNSFKCTGNKMKLWEEKAISVGLTKGQLDTWYKSMRTSFGKLTQKKSGQAAKNLTEREQWILRVFDFLKTHITRVPSRQACGVSRYLLIFQTIFKNHPIGVHVPPHC